LVKNVSGILNIKTTVLKEEQNK